MIYGPFLFLDIAVRQVATGKTRLRCDVIGVLRWADSVIFGMNLNRKQLSVNGLLCGRKLKDNFPPLSQDYVTFCTICRNFLVDLNHFKELYSG